MTRLAAAFAHPVFDSQSVFRAVMNALARPGNVMRVTPPVAAPPPLGPAAAAIALALLDYETPVWLDAPLAAQPAVADWLTFHTGAPITPAPEQAAFAFVADAAAAPDFAQFAVGTPEYPDRSTTIVMQVEALAGGEPLVLTGPGIEQTRRFSAAPLPADFADRLCANRALFPRGVDLLIACGDMLVGLPRSVRIERSR